MNKLPAVLEDITKEVRLKHYPKGQIIFYQGDTPDDVAILSDGYVKVYDIDDQGNEKILHIVNIGALVPFSFFSGGHRSIQWFYSALTDCDVYIISMKRLEQEFKNNNELAFFMMNWFSLEVHELLIRLSSLGKSNAKMKVCAALTFLMTHNAKSRPSGWRRVNFPVNHQLLADMTGVTRESVATIMKDLTNRKYVRNPRQTILEINEQKFS